MTDYILASASPRRHTLIELLGLPFRILVAEVDETTVTHPDPATNVVATARLKVQAVAALAGPEAFIVGADTTVALGQEMLGKPGDEAEARAMLRRLRGRVHQVHSGIVVLDQSSGRLVEEVASVDVPMRPYSEAEIEAYVATGDPLDKAGAYAIQHPQFQPAPGLAGCYSAVMGLPLCHLARALWRLQVPASPHIAQRCQAFHGYDCPVYRAILSPHL